MFCFNFVTLATEIETDYSISKIEQNRNGFETELLLLKIETNIIPYLLTRKIEIEFPSLFTKYLFQW